MGQELETCLNEKEQFWIGEEESQQGKTEELHLNP